MQYLFLVICLTAVCVVVSQRPITFPRGVIVTRSTTQRTTLSAPRHTSTEFKDGSVSRVNYGMFCKHRATAQIPMDISRTTLLLRCPLEKRRLNTQHEEKEDVQARQALLQTSSARSWFTMEGVLTKCKKIVSFGLIR